MRVSAQGGDQLVEQKSTAQAVGETVFESAAAGAATAICKDLVLPVLGVGSSGPIAELVCQTAGAALACVVQNALSSSGDSLAALRVPSTTAEPGAQTQQSTNSLAA